MTAAADFCRCDNCIDNLRAEVERLTRWQAEATTILDGWDQVWHALGEPGRLGDYRFTACLTEITRMRAELFETIAQRDRHAGTALRLQAELDARTVADRRSRW